MPFQNNTLWNKRYFFLTSWSLDLMKHFSLLKVNVLEQSEKPVYSDVFIFAFGVVSIHEWKKTYFYISSYI